MQNFQVWAGGQGGDKQIVCVCIVWILNPSLNFRTVNKIVVFVTIQ